MILWMYLPIEGLSICSMDTDSAYMALSTESLEQVIRPHLKQKFEGEKHPWIPRSDTPEHAAFDKRNPGLFKEEYSGDGIVALWGKTYYRFVHSDKFSCKGVNKNWMTLMNRPTWTSSPLHRPISFLFLLLKDIP